MVSFPHFSNNTQYPRANWRINPALGKRAGFANSVAAGVVATPAAAKNYSDSIAIQQQNGMDQALLNQALHLLGNIRNRPEDEAHMRAMGIHVLFNNGQEALQLIQSKGLRVEFGDMGDSAAHAQWLADQKLIMINQRYRNDASPATLYAISEAIYHEAGHAAKMVKDPVTGQPQNVSLASNHPNEIGDDQSSIQEELNCLALNTLAHCYHTAQDPGYAQTVSSSRLLSDGVALYTRLFFDSDPNKQALINRVVEKYGELPLSSPGHEVPQTMALLWPLAQRVFVQAGMQGKANAAQPNSSPFILPPALNTMPQPALMAAAG